MDPRQLCILCVFFFSACVGQVISYKIMVVAPVPIRSHYNIGKGVVDILQERGHEVTFVTCYHTEGAAFKEIVITEILQQFNKSAYATSTFENTKHLHADTLAGMVTTWLPYLINATLSNPKLQETMRKDSFDLVILEYYMNEAMIGFGVTFDCPVVLLSTISKLSWLSHLVGIPAASAIAPNTLLKYGVQMSLLERTKNTFADLVQHFLWWWMMMPRQKNVYEELFPIEASKVPFWELKKKIAVTLLTSHASIGVVRPLLPNVIEIGGYAEKKPEPLPQDLQDILDNAENGVIFFSLGSNMESATMPASLIADIVKVLSELNETVLWKFEEQIPELPKNVIIRNWLPQTSILAHPNVKLFISHGGLLSTTEAASAGVPLLAIPIFGDQFHNAKLAEERGRAVSLELSRLNYASFSAAIKEMLGNPKYKINAEMIHQIYFDRPMHPKDLVTFYSEHVIRTGGAKHLSPPDLNIFQLMLLDVAAVILIPFIAVIYLIVKLCKYLCRKIKKINIDKKNK